MSLLTADLSKTTSTVDLDRIIARIRQQILDEGTLPETIPVAALREGEVAHMIVNVCWSEMVREFDHRESFERLRHLADGTLQVTNQRFVFISATKNATIEFIDIVEVAILGDHLRVEVIGPNDPYFLVEPPNALEVTELVTRKAIELAIRHKRARLVGSLQRTRRRRRG